jgi:hypothetical protein
MLQAKQLHCFAGSERLPLQNGYQASDLFGYLFGYLFGRAASRIFVGARECDHDEFIVRYEQRGLLAGCDH